jgi:hypothetical protein
MNNLLRKVARELRYRPIPELIGTKVTIESASAVPCTVAEALTTLFPVPLRFIGPQEPWITVSLAKYCHLDLTFGVDGVEWRPHDDFGITTLKKLGFALHPRELSKNERQHLTEEKDPTCLRELAEDINQGGAVLRLFLEETPRRELLDYWKGVMKNGKGHLFEGGVDQMRILLEGFFPHDLAISDACLTNARFIWFHKHFYL